MLNLKSHNESDWTVLSTEIYLHMLNLKSHNECLNSLKHRNIPASMLNLGVWTASKHKSIPAHVKSSSHTHCLGCKITALTEPCMYSLCFHTFRNIKATISASLKVGHQRWGIYSLPQSSNAATEWHKITFTINFGCVWNKTKFYNKSIFSTRKLHFKTF